MSRFSIEAVIKAVDKFTRPMARIQGRMNKFTNVASRGLLKAGTAAVDFVGNLAKIIAVAGTAAVVIGGIKLSHDIIDTGSGFEQAIVNVGKVGLQTREEIADLEKKALSLGETTKFTATEAANAMEIMRRSGFSNAEVLSGIDGILSAAAASGLEIAEAADHVSNVLKGMGLETSKAKDVADVLTLASSRTNSTIGSLGESMRNVGSTARKLQIPLKDTVAMVALLQDVGLDASVSGSALNTMLTKLAALTPGAKKKLEALVGALSDDDFKNPLRLMEKMSIAAKKSGSNMEQVALFAELVGLRGQKAASNLAELFETGKLEELTQELENAEGAAKMMEDLGMDSLRGDWLLLGSAVDGVKTALFDMEGGPLRKIVETTTEWVRANKEIFKEKFQTFAGAVGKIAEKMPMFFDALPMLFKWAKVFGIVALAIGAVIAVLVILSLWVIAIPIAAAAAWVFFNDFFIGLWEGIKNMVFGAAEFIVGVWQGVVSVVTFAWNVVKGLAIIALEATKGVWGPIVEWFGDIFGSVGDKVSNVWESLTSWATKAYKNVTGVWGKLKEFFSDLWDGVVDTFRSFLGPIIDNIVALVNKLSDVGERGGRVEKARGGIVIPSDRPEATGGQDAGSRIQKEMFGNFQVGGKITVKDETGKAVVENDPGALPFIALDRTGAFQ